MFEKLPVGRRLLALAVVGVAMFATACDRGGSSESASTSTTVHDHGDEEAAMPQVDPCGLVTQAEAAGVLGPVASLSEDNQLAVGVTGGQRVCAISLQRDANWGANVGIADRGGAEKFQELGRRLPGLGANVPDLGDHAQWYDQFRMLIVQQGEDFLSIQLRGVVEDANSQRDQATQLARLALQRLSEDKRG